MAQSHPYHASCPNLNKKADVVSLSLIVESFFTEENTSPTCAHVTILVRWLLAGQFVVVNRQTNKLSYLFVVDVGLCKLAIHVYWADTINTVCTVHSK